MSIAPRSATIRPLALIAMMAFLGRPSMAATISTYSFDKSTVWDIADGSGGPGTGSYRYLKHAFAEDRDKRDHDQDNQQTGAVFGKLAKNLTPSAAVNDARVNSENEKWTDFTKFDQTDSLDTGVLTASASSTHPVSKATVQITTDYLPKVAPTWIFSDIKITGSAEVKTPLRDPETAYAEAASAGELTLTGKYSVATIKNGEAPEKKLDIKGSTLHLHSSSNAEAHTNGNGVNKPQVNDPVSLALYDSLTGELISSDVLFSLAATVDGMADIDFDSIDGLTFMADAGSTASLVVDTMSSWIRNAFHGGIGLSGGVLQTTGAFHGLPWEVNTIGGITTAHLPAADFNFDFNLRLQPNGLGSPTHDVLAVLEDDTDGLASAYATMPEPATFVLVGLALVAAGWRQRGAQGRLRLLFFPQRHHGIDTRGAFRGQIGRQQRDRQ